MKTKIVLWGENAENEKILLAIELLEKDNKILIHVFPQEVATEEFYQTMLDKWRENHEVVFPANHKTIERPLSVSDSLLPDDIKTERTDVISRAQAEWHFVVLSTKLYETYKGEIDELKEKIDSLSEYSENAWGDLVEFWKKVSTQIQEHTIFKEHSTILKERTNNLFDKMKSLKKEVQRQFESQSAVLAEQITSELAEIEDKISKGLGVRPLFEELKMLQKKYYEASMTRGDKNKVWAKIDAAFKALKENKGEQRTSEPRKGGGGESGRIQSRYDGLLGAIKKMEISVKKDQQEIDFQNKRISQSEGQLEMQIRQAKMKMVEERIKSKKEKLEDMYNTKVMLDSKLESINKRAKKDEAKEQVKSKIAEDIKSAEENRSDLSEKLEHAASEINESKSLGEKAGGILASIAAVVEEGFEDAVDTVKAVAEVLGDKAEDFVENIEDKLEEVSDKLEDKAEELKDSMTSSKANNEATQEEE
ncbi:MAG TPA: hypothetical protein PLY70_18430 [Saprospiraceae bacterium]|nr:hypothetical protein [Saprospiraceae bacterium]HPN70775.1 hypothetical protein [Saprospiraceae bacterium]